MSPDRLRLLLAAFVMLVSGLAVGCSQPQTIQIPAPKPVDLLYLELIQEKASNRTPSNTRVDQRQVMSFEGEITDIEDRKIQFHIDTVYWGRDGYVQCEFSEERKVIYFDKGQTVFLYGFLESVGTVVKFGNCGDYTQVK